MKSPTEKEKISNQITLGAILCFVRGAEINEIPKMFINIMTLIPKHEVIDSFTLCSIRCFFFIIRLYGSFFACNPIKFSQEHPPIGIARPVPLFC
jgi:hypothetical protein